MIRFQELEARTDELRTQFENAQPFPHVAIDHFCDVAQLTELAAQIPDPVSAQIKKSRDYMFARNKFEKSHFRKFGALFEELYSDLVSSRMQNIIRTITRQDVFIDTEFHGGGIHQGGKNSFLDMHTDFSHHPMHPTWRRNLNLLLYLNHNWMPEHKGELKLRHKSTNVVKEIVPLFNRCLIMHTGDFTLHGYDAISFPEGTYRRSIASYAYTLAKESDARPQSTRWYPENSNIVKASIGHIWPTLVRLKGIVVRSSTAKNT